MKKLLLISSYLILTFTGFSQDEKTWTAYLGKTDFLKDKGVARKTFPTSFKLFALRQDVMRNELFSIVNNAQNHTAIIVIPNADGEMEEFEMVEASNFEPILQEQYPEIRAFSGRGITDKGALLKLSYSPQGIQTMVIRHDERSTEFIEPYSADHRIYSVYKRSDRPGNMNWVCSTPEKEMVLGLNDQVLHLNLTARSGGDLKTMRLAQSVTAEYSNYFGATSAAQVNLVLAAINATLTRTNGCYEKDLALHLNLIANTTAVIYYNPSTDPYSAASSLSNWNSQLQSTLTSVIGDANYDIGHLFGASGGGGNAGCIGCVCGTGKGSAYTSPYDGIPQGDNFDIDYVAHEIGHQLGGNHTFSHSLEGTGVNKEVGSGITIMGYAGITNQDVAPHSIAFFHQATIAQVQSNLASKTCPVTTSLSGVNATPVVSALSNYTIPKSTPFALTGSATDANSSNVLTYCWEQNDNSSVSGTSSVASATKTGGPNWLTFAPTTTPIRYFPRLSTILTGGTLTGPLTGGDAGANIEALSSVARTLNFRLTVRDNAPYSSTTPVNVGQTQFTDMVVTVNGTAGPFAVTGLDAAGTSWVAGSSQTITWSVNSTNTTPVNCSTVNILLSTDGGQTFPITLVAGTANDGTQAVTIPNNATTAGRIKVEAVGNIFFDINNANFTITASAGNFTFNSSSGATVVCGSTTSATASLSSTATGGFNTPINLSASGNPSGTTVSFSANPLTPGSSTNVTLNSIGSLAPGTYNVTITGVAGSITQTTTIAFVISAGTITITTQPVNASVCNGRLVNFTVATSSSGVSYQWQQSANGGTTWTNISGATSVTYAIASVNITQNNYRYRVVITNLCGSATSTVAILTVKSSTQSNTLITACDSYSWNGIVYTNTGIYTFSRTNAAGCDSLAILNLTITTSSTTTTMASACDSYVWTTNGQTYTSTGTYTSVSGCVTRILNLTITPSSVTNTSASACDSYVWTTNGQAYTSTGTYTSVSGCVTHILNLTITPSSVSNTSASACDSYAWSANGQTYTSSGTYTSVSGCVTRILNLTITPSSVINTNASACGSYAWLANGQIYTSSGIYTSVSGCVTLILNLTIASNTVTSTSINACESYTWPLNNTTYSNSGSYTYTNECTTSVLQLSIGQIKNQTINAVACESYTLPWSVVVTASGTYSNIYTGANGCDSMVTVIVSLNQNVTSLQTVNICDNQLPYSWNGNAYTSSGTYSILATAENGCDSIAVLELRIGNTTSSSQTRNICSNQLPYSWNGVLFTTSGTRTVTLTNASGCDSTLVMNVLVNSTIPAAPSSVTQALITNNCGARVYRYTATAVSGMTGYSWLIPTTLGGITGVSIDSGDINSSRVIRLKYVSNTAAFTTDSIRVNGYNACGNSVFKAFKLTNTALNPPAAPASITITAISTNVCGARIYRYTAPVLPAGTATVTAATGYIWSFTGNLGGIAIIDSGNLNSRIIRVRYTSNAASVAGDSVRVCYTSVCGNSLNRASKLTNTLLNPPAAPASITITALAPSVCGGKIYRYTAPALPLATTTAGAATGYLWSFSGVLGANATIDSGTMTSRIIRVKYTLNIAAIAGDSVRVRYNSDCGYGSNKSAKLTNVFTSTPAAPASITITPVSAITCGARVYRYTAPILPAATATLAAATGYEWVFTGVLGVNAVIDSGTANSRIILVRYSSNAAAVTGDSVKLRYQSSCGYSPYKASKLSNTALTCLQANLFVKNVGEGYKPNVLVYPNPFSHQFGLQYRDDNSGTIDIRAYNQQGMLIERKKASSLSGLTMGESWKSGMYYLELMQGGKLQRLKLIKL